jgi:hypothetical protein
MASTRRGKMALGQKEHELSSGNVPIGKHAAFPSLDVTKPPRELQHEIEKLVDDRSSADKDVQQESLELMEKVWRCEKFPENMTEDEKKWYREVQDKIEVAGESDEVRNAQPLNVISYTQ